MKQPSFHWKDFREPEVCRFFENLSKKIQVLLKYEEKQQILTTSGYSHGH